MAHGENVVPLRQPVRDEALERELVAMLLRSGEALPANMVQRFVTSPPLRVICHAMLKCIERAQPVNSVTVLGALQDAGEARHAPVLVEIGSIIPAHPDSVMDRVVQLGVRREREQRIDRARMALARGELEEARRELAEVETANPTGPAAFGVSTWTGTAADLFSLTLPKPSVIVRIGSIEVRAQESVLLRGQANVYKSFLALLLCVLAAAQGHKVLIVEGEGGLAALQRRLLSLARGLFVDGIDQATAARITIVHGGFALAERIDAWRALIDRVKPAVVQMDPLVTYNTGDENSAQEVGAFLSMLDIAKHAGAAIILVHHSTKPNHDGKTSARGSSALRAWCDHELEMSLGDEPSTAVVSHEKNREGERAKPQLISWSFSEESIAMTVSSIDAQGDRDARQSNEDGRVGEIAVQLVAALAARPEGVRGQRALRELVRGRDALVHRAIARASADGRIVGGGREPYRVACAPSQPDARTGERSERSDEP